MAYLYKGEGWGRTYHKPYTCSVDAKNMYDHHLEKHKGPLQSKRHVKLGSENRVTAYLLRTKYTTSCIERALSSKVNNDRANGHCYTFARIY